MNATQRHLAVDTVVGLARTLYPSDMRMLKLLSDLQSAPPRQFGSALRAVTARGNALAWREARGLAGATKRFTFSAAVNVGIKQTLASTAQD